MKANPGNFFEDFRLEQVIEHATPRTITAGDVALYTALYGSRFAVQSSDEFARAIGYARAPVDDLLVFHVVFGKTVPDVSFNAIANLGYAECRFTAPVFPGDTIAASSRIIGLKENSSQDSGIVWLRTTGRNQHNVIVLEYVRWVMVRKRDKSAPPPAAVIPQLVDRVPPESLGSAVPRIAPQAYNSVLAGSRHRYSDYCAGEQTDHLDGITIEEAEHQLATRLYQNTAKVHFNAHAEATGRNGRRLVYGGVIMSLARALSYNGLGNAFHVAAINGGRHIAPCFAGDTIYAFSQVLEKADVPDRADIGALRVRLSALKNVTAAGWSASPKAPGKAGALVLELDAWVILPASLS